MERACVKVKVTFLFQKTSRRRKFFKKFETNIYVLRFSEVKRRWCPIFLSLSSEEPRLYKWIWWISSHYFARLYKRFPVITHFMFDSFNSLSSFKNDHKAMLNSSVFVSLKNWDLSTWVRENICGASSALARLSCQHTQEIWLFQQLLKFQK